MYFVLVLFHYFNDEACFYLKTHHLVGLSFLEGQQRVISETVSYVFPKKSLLTFLFGLGACVLFRSAFSAFFSKGKHWMWPLLLSYSKATFFGLGEAM